MKETKSIKILKEAIGEDDAEFKAVTSSKTRIVNFRSNSLMHDDFISHCFSHDSSFVLKRLIWIYIRLFKESKRMTKDMFMRSKWHLISDDEYKKYIPPKTTNRGLWNKKKEVIEDPVSEEKEIVEEPKANSSNPFDEL